jgi:hypothetical protein
MVDVDSKVSLNTHYEELSDDETELLVYYNQLPQSEKEAVKNYIKTKSEMESLKGRD